MVMMMIKAQLPFYLRIAHSATRSYVDTGRVGHTARAFHFAVLRAKGTCDDYDDYLYLSKPRY